MCIMIKILSIAKQYPIKTLDHVFESNESHVRSLKRHVCGVRPSVTSSIIMDGLPIPTFKNLPLYIHSSVKQPKAAEALKD